MKMLGKHLPLFLLVGFASATLQGVDPNSLSCDPNGQVYLLLPHFSDCAKFYQCAHGNEVEMNCPAGTIFDFENQICNHIWATTCSLRSHNSTQTTAKPSEDTTHRDPNSITCDLEGLIAQLLPHFTDCKKYYQCVHGNEVERDCPAGTIFDFDLQICNHEWAVDCVLRQPESEESSETTEKPNSEEEGSGDEPGTESNEGEGSGEGEWSNNLKSFLEFEDEPLAVRRTIRQIILSEEEVSSEVIESFGEKVLNCLSLDDAAKRVPYKGDCQRYWRCIDHTPQAVACSEGLYFNSVTQECDHVNSAHCNVAKKLGEEFLTN